MKTITWSEILKEVRRQLEHQVEHPNEPQVMVVKRRKKIDYEIHPCCIIAEQAQRRKQAA